MICTVPTPCPDDVAYNCTTQNERNRRLATCNMHSCLHVLPARASDQFTTMVFSVPCESLKTYYVKTDCIHEYL
jgi:hypothetical protein